MDQNEKHEMVKTLFVNAMKDAENLNAVSKGDLKEMLVEVASICYVAVDAFEEAKDT